MDMNELIKTLFGAANAELGNNRNNAVAGLGLSSLSTINPNVLIGLVGALIGGIGQEDAEPRAEYFVRRKYNGSVDEEYGDTTKAGAIEELRDYYITALNDEMGNTCADSKVVEAHYEEESAYIVLRDGTKIEWEIDWDGE